MSLIEIDKFTHTRTTGTYTKTKMVPAPKAGIMEHLRRNPHFNEVSEEVSFDTAAGDEENLTGEWEQHYEASFEIAGLYFYVEYNRYDGTSPCGYLVLAGHRAIACHGSTISIHFDAEITTPLAKLSFIKGSPKQNRVNIYGYDAKLFFKDREQFSAYTSTLEEEDVVIAKVRSIR